MGKKNDSCEDDVNELLVWGMMTQINHLKYDRWLRWQNYAW